MEGRKEGEKEGAGMPRRRREVRLEGRSRGRRKKGCEGGGGRVGRKDGRTEW